MQVKDAIIVYIYSFDKQKQYFFIGDEAVEEVRTLVVKTLKDILGYYQDDEVGKDHRMECSIYDIVEELKTLIENPDRMIYRGGFGVDNFDINIDFIGDKFEEAFAPK